MKNMAKKGKVWYRDEIEQLKVAQSHIHWKIGILITVSLALFSLCYLVWYEEKGSAIRVLIIMVFICILIFTKKQLQKEIYKGQNISKQINKNYSLLLAK